MAVSGTLRSQIRGEIGIEREQFRRFDVVADDDSDHFYRNSSTNKKKTQISGNCFTNTSSRVHKKIMNEWKVLEKNLPDSIYVRVYESRIDLLRAVIVGSPGTPYHGGLFFFDLSFPPDYPTQPPKVHYHSFGLRLNPNLYASGFVCLSLLNTWQGKKQERWNPSESTILQVLVSIQGLVLNEKPYYNEPGVGSFPGQGKKSSAYNENVFVLSCKTMVYLLRRPPKNFEDFVTWHFLNRAHEILTTCNAYMDGLVRIGEYADNRSNSHSKSVHVSSDFNKMMKSWYPEMVTAFSKTGASLENFVEQVRVEKETTSFKPVAAAKNKENSEGKTVSSKPQTTTNTIEKAIGKIMKILGFKKTGKVNGGGEGSSTRKQLAC